MTAFSHETELVLVHLLMQLVVILGASRLIGQLFRRLGHAQAMGEIFAGVLLGPSFFGWLAPDLFAALFRADGPPILPFFSHMGLILALFLIGMEFDYREVPRFLPQVAGAAVATLVAPMLAAAAIAPALWSVFPGQGSYLAYVLFLGLIFAITAIPIMGRVLIETGLQRTRVGVLGITTGATKDLFTWFILLLVVGLAQPPLVPSALATTVVGVLGLGWVTLTLGARLVGIAERRFGYAGDRPTGHLIAFLLGYAFVLAACTSALGVFAIFGAFLAGVSVSRHRGLAVAVADRLHDLTIYLFLPIFFTSTGLRTDLSALEPAAWMWALAVTVVGSVASGGVATLAGRWGGMEPREALAYGVLINTPGLMVLILLNVGLDVGVIPPALFGVMMANAMARNLLTTPALRRLSADGLPEMG